MPEIKNFKGVFYNKEKVDIANVVTPPYDVISKREQEIFYNKSEYNIIRLILGKEFESDNEMNNRYTRAADYLNAWFKNKILIQDEDESIYFLEEEFYVDGVKKSRKGFISLAKLEDFSEGNILPHEKTMLGPKADRLNLTKACKCNFSQIFSVYSDEKGNVLNIFYGAIEEETPFLNVEYDNKNYRIWKVTNPEDISKLQGLIRNKKIFIADGHHRYETALAYREYRKSLPDYDDKAGYNYVMMYFSPIENNDLLILPTHRGVKHVNFNEKNLLDAVKEFFEIESFNKSELTNIIDILKKNKDKYTVFAVYGGQDKIFILKFKNSIKEKLSDIDKLDVQILQKFIFEKFLNITQEDLDKKTKIEYVKDIDYGIGLVDKGELEALFILNPTKIEQVKDIALSGQKMPQKSTYFYPKLITGLVINKIE